MRSSYYAFKQDIMGIFPSLFKPMYISWIGDSKFNQFPTVNILGCSQIFTMLYNAAINVFELWQIQEGE